MAKLLCKIMEIEKFRKIILFVLILSSKLFELQRHTIPHFKALDLLFCPLAWVLTLGVIILEICHKVPVAFFMHHPLCYSVSSPIGISLHLNDLVYQKNFCQISTLINLTPPRMECFRSNVSMWVLNRL